MPPLGTESIKVLAASRSFYINCNVVSILFKRSITEKYDIVPIATAASIASKLRAGSEMDVLSDSFITITDYLVTPLILLSLHQEI